MRMSDVMSGLGLAIYPTIALVIFLGVFVCVILHVTDRKRRAALDAAALLPLADDAVVGDVRIKGVKARAESTTPGKETHQ